VTKALPGQALGQGLQKSLRVDGAAPSQHLAARWPRRYSGAVPYDLRHSFASLLIHEGELSIVEIANQLGHSTETLLRVYAHVIAEMADQPKFRLRRRSPRRARRSTGRKVSTELPNSSRTAWDGCGPRRPHRPGRWPHLVGTRTTMRFLGGRTRSPHSVRRCRRTSRRVAPHAIIQWRPSSTPRLVANSGPLNLRRSSLLPGPRAGRSWRSSGKDKTAVVGIRQRGEETRAAVIGNIKRPTLHAHVADHVEPGATV
jgi:hypothetical protein